MPAKDYPKEKPRLAKLKKPKGRQPKKYSIKVDNDEIMRPTGAVIIGIHQAEQSIQLNIAGKISFEEMIDMFNNAQYELLHTFFNAAAEGLSDEECAKLTRDIYDRAVLGFSLMIDRFFPEGKNDKFEGFTNEAIINAQNAELRRRVEAKKK